MKPTQELIDALYREEVIRARRSSPEQKLLSGPRLFDWACEMTKAGIRVQFPDADEQRVLEILKQRLELRRRLEGCR
jgi:hypothetical protein